jgi:Glucodextranase, domain B
MLSKPQHTQPSRDHSEQSVSDGTEFGPGSTTHPRRCTRRASKAIGVCAAAAVALMALVSSGCGSTTTTTTSAVGAGAVTVALTSPTSGSVIAADHVTVRGTVSPANATVQVQGQPAAVGNGVFTGTATLHGGKTTIDVIGSAPGATPGSTSILIARQSAGGSGGTPRPVSGAATPAIPNASNYSATDTACGNGLAVGPATTCAFAENVRSAYDSSGPGTVTAYSPVTNRTYAMTCSNGSSVVCTGGNNASVYFSSQSAGVAYQTTRQSYGEPASAAANGSSYSGQTNCGGGLAVGANTTCAFAENVRSAYDSSGPGTVMAYSPVTNRTYAMTCSAGSPVVCTGGNDASVYLP